MLLLFFKLVYDLLVAFFTIQSGTQYVEDNYARESFSNKSEHSHDFYAYLNFITCNLHIAKTTDRKEHFIF